MICILLKVVNESTWCFSPTFLNYFFDINAAGILYSTVRRKSDNPVDILKELLFCLWTVRKSIFSAAVDARTPTSRTFDSFILVPIRFLRILVLEFLPLPLLLLLGCCFERITFNSNYGEGGWCIASSWQIVFTSLDAIRRGRLQNSDANTTRYWFTSFNLW